MNGPAPGEKRRRRAEVAGLFALGAAAVGAGFVAPDRLGFSAGFGALVAALVAAAVGAGLVEAASVRRTGRRRWMGSWLPAAAGMLAVLAAGMALGPQGPDAGVAWGIALAGYAVVVPCFALVVNTVASVAGWVVPSRRIPPGPPPA